MRTRLKDIAEELDLSPGLVSGVLNGRDNVWASEDTRRKIFEAASRLNYEHNAPVKQRPVPVAGSIELVYCRSQRPHGSEMSLVVEALTHEAERLGLALVLRSFSDFTLAAEHYSGQTTLAADLVLVWSDGEDVSGVTDIVTSLGVPSLVYGEIEGKRLTVSQFSLNVEDIVTGAIDHLRVLGHRRIAFLGVKEDTATSRSMRAAFIAKMKQSMGQVPLSHWICEPEPQFEDYRKSIDRLLSLPEADQPTGFFVADGNLAWSVLELSLAEAGLVLGFGRENRTCSGLFRGPFHLIYGDALAYDFGEVGAQFAASLRELVRGQDEGSRLQIHRFLPRLARIPSFHSSISNEHKMIKKKELL